MSFWMSLLMSRLSSRGQGGKEPAQADLAKNKNSTPDYGLDKIDTDVRSGKPAELNPQDVGGAQENGSDYSADVHTHGGSWGGNDTWDRYNV